MKKVLLVIFGLIVLAGGAGAFFIVTFDANRYKGLLEEKLSAALGKPVRTERVSLRFSGGIALEVSKLAVYPDDSVKNPEISLEKIAAQVRLLPLLQKRLQLGSITLVKPSAVVLKRADGSVLVGGIDLSKKAVAGEPSSGEGQRVSMPEALAFSVDSITIRDGYLLYRDRSGVSPMDLEVKDFDLSVKNFSLTRPFDFQAAASVMSAGQNLKISGRAWLPGSKPAGVENFHLKTNLSDLDLAQLSAALPSFQESLFRERPRGELEVKVKRLEAKP